MLISMAGRAAIITGGSEGLGRAMARRFSQSGADVAILARRPEVLEETRRSLQESAQGRILAVTCDVRDPAGLRAAFEAAETTFGKVDILVNNAGGAMTKPFEDVTDGDWEADIQLKLMAQVRLTRLVLPGMKARGWGRIINVLNNMARSPLPNSSPTSVTRAAGLAAAKALSHEVAKHNITVNCMLVGLIRTEQIEGHAIRAGVDVEAFVEEYAAHVPMGRIGRPEEFADMACFLASENASYITGVGINIDGGTAPVG